VLLPGEYALDAHRLRHNLCQPADLAGRATPPHLQNQLDVAFVCFRPYVRNGRLYGCSRYVSRAPRG